MKERGIIFQSDMVRAILDGRKTLTSRLKGLDMLNEKPDAWRLTHSLPEPLFGFEPCWDFESNKSVTRVKCPYGHPGDRLWVKETFALEPKRFAGDKVIFRADGKPKSWPWKPSIFMPRWASRITLEIVRVWMSMVQDMTEDQAKQEGCYPVTHEDGSVDCGTSKKNFAIIWDRINAKRGHSWAYNPYVWRVEFKRVYDQ